ncbi:MAG: hypothetical protein KQH63_11960 [Desulfobulbaceae bacterium]|nr:hypothetical protein [Desulfobulbaceae bacterium]
MSDDTVSAQDILSGAGGGDPLFEKLDYALTRLEQASIFNKYRFQGPVLDMARRMMAKPGGIPRLYELAPRFESAGLFNGTDWANPAILLPKLVRNTLLYGDRSTVMLECLSQLRLLSVANGILSYPDFSVEHARHFLTRILALNLNFLFVSQGESERERLLNLKIDIGELFQFLLSHIDFENIIEVLTDEIWRILVQRPIQVSHVKKMVGQIAESLSSGAGSFGDTRLGVDRLISALYGPTQGSLDNPSPKEYLARLDALDFPGLQQEANGFARAMLDTGLVSDKHAFFLRWLLENEQETLISSALGLSSTGLDVLRCYQELVHRLIQEAVYPETSQVIYGLTMLLERGILYAPPIAPGLWRQIGLRLSSHAEKTLAAAFGDALPPRIFLLAGVVSLLGQPLGVSQGNNPTCQSARALSMWSFNDPDFLLHLIVKAARFDNVTMHFEGQAISSAELPAGLINAQVFDSDPVSVLLVPHLDRIYMEMGRLCAGRGEDPHLWVNPEFHGWWVGRKFAIAVDVNTGMLKDYEAFVRQFYACYHPFYNGNQPVIHPQPVGIAVTDSSARFVGWHAITLIRVALDQENVVRVYFYNPNNDSGQDWGNGVVVSTQGFGERFGEGSLPFAEFASRLYIFHDDSVEEDSVEEYIPRDELHGVQEMAQTSWAAGLSV